MRILALAVLVIVISSCKKTEVIEPVLLPEMKYIPLNDAEISAGTWKGVDVDEDGMSDFYFNTLLVGDPLLQQDKLQFYANSRIEDYLLNNESEQTPGLYKNEIINIQYPGYEWNHISAIILAEKVTGMTEPPFWRGNWKDALHRYLPIRINRNGQSFLGWIELSFHSETEKLILHRAALSKIPDLAVKAG